MVKITHTYIAIVVLNLAAALCAFAEVSQADPAPSGALPSTVVPHFTEGFSRRAISLVLPSDGPAENPGASVWRPRLAAAEAGVSSLSEAGPVFAAKEAGSLSADVAGTAERSGWSWRRATAMDYTAVSIAAVGTAYFEHENGKPSKPKWTSRNRFDESVRNTLRLENRDARDAAHTAGNVLMGVMIAAPVLEPLAVLGFRDSRWDELWQTEMINAEAFTFTSLVSSLMQNLTARQRPFVRNCVAGKCEGDLENRGMPSGHVAFAFTGAGLICNHHKYQPFYGDSAADSAACATGIGLATVEGVVRIMADRHYATDVAVGAVIGLFSGFVLPRLLTYSRPREASVRKKTAGGDPGIELMTLSPQVFSGGAGLTCDFRF